MLNITDHAQKVQAGDTSPTFSFRDGAGGRNTKRARVWKMATEDVLGELGGLAAIKAMESWPAQPPSAAETQCRQAISSRLNALLSGGDLAHGQLAEIEELSCALCADCTAESDSDR